MKKIVLEIPMNHPALKSIMFYGVRPLSEVAEMMVKREKEEMELFKRRKQLRSQFEI